MQTVPQNTPTAPPSGLDPQLVTLAKSLRQVESGGNFAAKGASGEYGGYQFMPTTWAENAPRFGVTTPLEQASPADQNKVAYMQLSEWKQQHPEWNIGNFASAWNAGPGKPNAYRENYKGVNAQGVAYDTPGYAARVAQNYQQFKQQAPQEQPALAPEPPTAPSIGGFTGNVVKSGANLLGSVGEAILHPIQTVQNIGGAAVGGLEKLGGQENENTQKFDNLIGYFKDRYGGLDNLEKTIYDDPVGFAADLASVITVGAGAAGLASKGAQAAGATRVADGLSRGASALSKAGELTNPLTPVVNGVSKAVQPLKEAAIGGLGKFAGLEPSSISVARTGALTPEAIANTTREAVGAEVKTALDKRLSSLSETGTAYAPIRAAQTEIPVAKNFLETQLRELAGLVVKDGEIIATTKSQIRTVAELAKIQKTFDLYKPSFQKGKLTPEEYLNLRSDLADIAYNDLGRKSTDVARITDKIRAKLNAEYRGKIDGLEKLDLSFSKQQQEFKDLKKGLFDAHGKPTDSLTKLVANAGNKGNEARLTRLEKLVPGITKKLELLKAVEDYHRSIGTKVGTYGRSIVEAGGLVGGLATGQVAVVAAGFAAGIIGNPATAVKILQALDKIDPALTKLVLARIAKYATVTGVASTATETLPSESPSEPLATEAGRPPSSNEAPASLPSL